MGNESNFDGIFDAEPTDGLLVDEESKNELGQAEGRLRASMYQATKKTPDEALPDVQLAKETGMPTGLVERNPERVKHQLRYEKSVPNNIAAESPHTTDYLFDPAHAAISSDDVENLQRLERLITEQSDKEKWGNYFGSEIGTLHRAMNEGLNQMIGGGIEGVSRTLHTAVNDYIDSIEVPPEVKEAMNKALKEVVKEKTGVWVNDLEIDFKGTEDNFRDMMTTPSKFGIEVGQNVKGYADYWRVPEGRRGLRHDIAAGLGQVSGQIAMALIAPPSAGIMMFGQGADQQYQRMIDMNQEVTLERMVAGGIVTMAAEAFGIDRILNRLAPMPKKKIVGWLTDIAIAGGTEAAEEMVEAIAHRLVEFTIGGNKNVELIDIDARELLAAGGTGAIARMFVRKMRPTEIGIHDSREQQDIDALIKAAQESKTRERDPDASAIHAQKVLDGTAANGDIFIDANGLSEVIQTLDQSQPVVQAMAEQIEEAKQIQGDVVVPLSDFIAHLTDPAIVDKIRPHLRMNQDSLTQAELASVDANKQAEISRVMEESLKHEQLRNDSTEFESLYAEQLVEAGNMSKSEAKMSSKLLGAYATTLAANKQISIKEAYNRLGLTIKRGRPDEKVATPTGIAYTQNFADVEFKETVIEEETGKEVLVTTPLEPEWKEATDRKTSIDRIKDCMNA